MPAPAPPTDEVSGRLVANLSEFVSEPYRTILYDDECHPVRLPGYRVDATTDAAIPAGVPPSTATS